MQISPAETQDGDLKMRPVPSLFMDLSAMNASGALVLTRDGISKTIHFDGGSLIFASSTDPNDRLGQVLVRSGELKLVDFMTAQSLLTPGVKFGSLLVEKGLLPAEKLIAAVLGQVRSIILSVFDWDHGDFSFTPRSQVPKDIIRLDIAARDLVREGIRRIDRVQAVIDGLGGVESSFRLTPDCERFLEGWKLDKEENLVLAKLGDPKSLIQLCGPGVNDFELARFLWALKVLGIIQPVSEADTSIDSMMADAFGGPAPAPVAAVTMHLSKNKSKKQARSDTDAAFDRLTEPAAAAAPSEPQDTPPGSSTQPVPVIDAPPETIEPEFMAAPEGPVSEPEPAPEPASEPVQSAIPDAPAPGVAAAPAEEEEFEEGFTSEDLEFGIDAATMEAITPSAPETAAKVEAPADEISRALADFGIKHKKIAEILNSKAAEKTGSFIGFCLREVRKSHPRLFQGVESDPSGILPLDKLLGNIRSQKLSNYSSGFLDFHEVLTRRAKTWQGADIARACREAADLPALAD